jgi:hypothetical protein
MKMGFSFYLTEKLVEIAVEKILRLVGGIPTEEETGHQGINIVVLDKKGKELYFKSWYKRSEEFRNYARKKAEVSLREKKDLCDLLTKFSAKLKKGDPLYPGGIYSHKRGISIGVSGFNKAEVDDGFARHILVEIGILCDLAKRNKEAELKSKGKLYLE